MIKAIETVYTLGDRVRIISSSHKGHEGTIFDLSRSKHYLIRLDRHGGSIGCYSEHLQKIGHVDHCVYILRAIYALSEPHSEKAIRYVGYSSNLKQRYQCHLSGSECLNNRGWIIDLKRRGLRPDLSVLDYAYTELDAWNCERYWIYQLIFSGAKLLNREMQETASQDLPRLIAAYNAARQARFEHGESGRR